mgnify:FL=1
MRDYKMRLCDIIDIKSAFMEKTDLSEEEIQTIIDDILTAYDIDKVVEQLEELNRFNLNLADCMLDIQLHGLNRHFICLEDAIEIVKAGGIDG